MPDRADGQHAWAQSLQELDEYIAKMLGDGVPLTDEERTSSFDAFQVRYGGQIDSVVEGITIFRSTTDRNALLQSFCGMGECFAHAWRNGDMVEAFAFVLEMRLIHHRILELQHAAGGDS